MKNTQTNKIQNSNEVNNISPKESKLSIFARTFLVLFMLFAGIYQAFAIDDKISGWANNVDTALNLAVGVFAVVGAFLIFIQYMQGNEQAQKNLIRFIIGLAIFGLSAQLVTLFTGS